MLYGSGLVFDPSTLASKFATGLTTLVFPWADAAVQVWTGVGPVLLTLQVMVIQLLPAAAVCGEQLLTGAVTLLDPHVVVVQLLPAVGVCAVQVPTFDVPVTVWHFVSV